jgi:flagellar hook-associated protein 1 FlgK
MQISVDDANGLLGSIAQSNYQIKVATMQHDETNELNDTRGQYLDRLSQYMNIDVIPNSDGTVSVFSGGTKLLDGAQDHIDSDNPPLELESPSGGDTSLTANGTQMDLTGGAFYGAMQVLNGKGGFAGAGENRFRGLPYYQASLDSLANSLSDTFNTLNGAGKPLFTGSGARDIAISDQWLDDPNYITATNDAGDAAKNRGKNDNILKMVEAMDKDQTIGSSNVSFGGYVLSMVGDVAIDVGHTSDISETSDMVFRTVDNQRESMMGVSLNEEAANLIKYQKAFSASARVMTAMDEALDTIINRMGTVGR